jgi:hypothetical protein
MTWKIARPSDENYRSKFRKDEERDEGTPGGLISRRTVEKWW